VAFARLPFLSLLLLCSQHAMQAHSSSVDCRASTFTIVGYQFAGSQPANFGQVFMSYRVTLMNSGMAEGFVHGTLASLNPFAIRIPPGQDSVGFGPVAADSQVTGSFTILVNPTAPVDFSQLQWTFDTTAAVPVAFPGPDQTVEAGTQVDLNGSTSTNASCGEPLTYHWRFSSRPAGSDTQLFFSSGATASFLADVPGIFVIQLVVSNSGFTSAVSSVVRVTEPTQ
jgi:hypothetical protein